MPYSREDAEAEESERAAMARAVTTPSPRKPPAPPAPRNGLGFDAPRNGSDFDVPPPVPAMLDSGDSSDSDSDSGAAGAAGLTEPDEENGDDGPSLSKMLKDLGQYSLKYYNSQY